MESQQVQLHEVTAEQATSLEALQRLLAELIGDGFDPWAPEVVNIIRNLFIHNRAQRFVLIWNGNRMPSGVWIGNHIVAGAKGSVLQGVCGAQFGTYDMLTDMQQDQGKQAMVVYMRL